MTAVASQDVLGGFDRNLIPVALEQPVIAKGKGSWVEDLDGKRYLDLVAGPGVLPLGHCHPATIAALEHQSRKLLQSPGKFITEPVVELATRLADILPTGVDRTFFCNSGAEANEGALKLAKRHSGLKAGGGAGIIAFQHSFHGRTTHALAVTGAPKYKRGLDTFLTVPGVIHVPYAYPLRLDTSDPVGFVLDALETAVKVQAQGSICALIIEAVQAVGGVIVPPEGFLSAVREFCTQNEITMIVDEVFTGFGRTGTMFACEIDGVSPDVITMAKALGGGLPLGGFSATEELASAAANREHFTTFGANSAISCAAGVAALKVIQDEDLAGRAASSGARMVSTLKGQLDGSPNVLEVRGRGLLVGIEVGDKDNLAPRADLAQKAQREALEAGLLVSVSGTFDNVIRLSPPLNISQEDVDHATSTLGRILSGLG
jgi:4-aminobutyrate aminotransferase-like enzyme